MLKMFSKQLRGKQLGQDKHIKKHQVNIESLREKVRNRKDEILSKIDVNKLLANPKQYLLKIGTDFYADNSEKVKSSIKSGEILAKGILKTRNVQSKDQKIKYKDEKEKNC